MAPQLGRNGGRYSHLEGLKDLLVLSIRAPVAERQDRNDHWLVLSLKRRRLEGTGAEHRAECYQTCPTGLHKRKLSPSTAASTTSVGAT
jgi:hypothetical protein